MVQNTADLQAIAGNGALHAAPSRAARIASEQIAAAGE
jgi:hypothetical protein